MAVLCVSVVTACMLLSVLFAPGVWTDCEKAKLFVTAPKKIQALSGSCLQIPCIFRVNDSKAQLNSSRKIIGMWIKNKAAFYFYPENVIFNSGNKVNKYPMIITGNLNDKNCTTLFSNLRTEYTNTYYFRIEKDPFLETAFCDPFQITVFDSPWRPTVEISGDLKEKESVTVTCSALTPCPHSPPKLTWNLQQDSHNRMEENEDGTFTTKIQQTITLSDQHDGNTIICSAAYPVNDGGVKTAEETKTLSVSYAPKDTSVSVSPSGLVSAGSQVNLTCSSRANPPARFLWFKNNRNGPEFVSDRHTFTVTDGGDYYCLAVNYLSVQMSPGSRLTGGDDPQFVYITVKILGSILLCCTFIICQVWLRSRGHNKPVESSNTADDINRVTEIQAS